MLSRLTTAVPPTSVLLNGLTRLGYSPESLAFDEAVDSGVPRPHWHTFFRSITELGSNELTRRWRDAAVCPRRSRPGPAVRLSNVGRM